MEYCMAVSFSLLPTGFRATNPWIFFTAYFVLFAAFLFGRLTLLVSMSEASSFFPWRVRGDPSLISDEIYQ